MKLLQTALAAALLTAPAFAQDKSMSDEKAGVDKATAKPMDQTAKTMDHSPTSSIKMDDARLATMLHELNQSEIKSGEMAMKQGNSQAIKDYGKMLKEDHSKGDDELKSIAKKGNLKLDQDKLMPEDRLTLDNAKMKMEEIQKMKGPDFDKAFATQMATAHQSVIDMVKKSRPDLTNADLKAFTDKLIPGLEKHRDMAQDIASGKTTAMHH
jgi:putative membrane protein